MNNNRKFTYFILKKSFQIQSDAKDEILKNIPMNIQHIFYDQIDLQHYHLDLSKVLVKKIEIYSTLKCHFDFLDLDTVSDQRFHSYRRDKDLSGRQLSFVALR